MLVAAAVHCHDAAAAGARVKPASGVYARHLAWCGSVRSADRLGTGQVLLAGTAVSRARQAAEHGGQKCSVVLSKQGRCVQSSTCSCEVAAAGRFAVEGQADFGVVLASASTLLFVVSAGWAIRVVGHG